MIKSLHLGIEHDSKSTETHCCIIMVSIIRVFAQNKDFYSVCKWCDRDT